MTDFRIRTIFFSASSIIAIAVLMFLFVINLGQDSNLNHSFFGYIVLLFAASLTAFAVFFYKGEIFDKFGKLRYNIISAVIFSVLLMMQIAFVFANFAHRQMQASFKTINSVNKIFESIDSGLDYRSIGDKIKDLPPEIDCIYITGHPQKKSYPILYSYGNSNNASHYIVKSNSDQFIFRCNFSKSNVETDDFNMILHISKSYKAEVTKKTLLHLFTLLITGIFFCYELILFIMLYIKRKIAKDAKQNNCAAADQNKMLEPLLTDGLAYVRQLTFLFYFSSRMASAFVPIVAMQFVGKTGNSLASGIPQTAETALTCIAIFITSEIMIRKGWKPPFIFGLAVVAAGTLLSSLAVNLTMFIFARAVIGLGYGLCWMTLRNLAMLSCNPDEQHNAFIQLNAGLFAGMNCGAVLGAILSETIGFQNVFLLSSVFTFLCIFALLPMQNAMPAIAKNEKTQDNSSGNKNSSSIIPVIAFVILMVTPACIMDSYTEYFLPRYAFQLGKEPSDIGRAQLLYGSVLVFFAPKISRVLRRRLGDGVRINLLFCLLLSFSLILTGIIGGFNVMLLSVLILGVGGSFGFASQNNFFIAMPFFSNVPTVRSLAWISFFKKCGVMLGPLSFAFAMSFNNRIGIITMGIVFTVFALAALPVLKSSRHK
ncbi:MAG: MFS transporter [Spirochaetaceae bacterium]|jgi:predicted MFS family arabinose efflux permease|nr:MFS transporter [Spirochaetaceae bacterium]